MPFPQLNVVIYSRDTARARAFYGALGYLFVVERHGDGPAHYACDLGGAVLEIYPWRKKPDASFLSASSIRLTLEVEDLERLLDVLRPLARRTERTPPLDGAPRSARLIDPDGNQVLLIEERTAASP